MAQADESAPGVILVHGLWFGPLSVRLLSARLKRTGFQCRAPRYPTVRSGLAANARTLRRYIGACGDGTLHLVGHSLGGLVILRMLDEYGDLPPGRVVLLGSPVNGSCVAGRIGGLGLTRPLLGFSWRCLSEGFRHAPPGREVGVIAGTLSSGLGRLVMSLPRPNDGTVSVQETRLPGAADTLELPVSHTGLVLSPRVATATAQFLSSGRFAPADGKPG